MRFEVRLVTVASEAGPRNMPRPTNFLRVAWLLLSRVSAFLPLWPLALEADRPLPDGTVAEDDGNGTLFRAGNGVMTSGAMLNGVNSNVVDA